MITASSAAEALEILKESKPALLISDIGMPGEDGYDLIRKVRALAEDIAAGFRRWLLPPSPDQKIVSAHCWPDISFTLPNRLSHPSY